MKAVSMIAGVLALGGCSLGGKAPRQLLSLSATAAVAPGTVRTAQAGETVTVLVPSAAAALAGQRVPVYDGGIAVAYVKDARWIDTPARQFQRLLSETVAARTGRVVLDLRQSIADPGTQLSGSLVAFGIDAAAGQAVVTFDASLARTSTSVTTRRFEARVPVATIDALGSATALNQAANSVAADVAAWLGQG